MTPEQLEAAMASGTPARQRQHREPNRSHLAELFPLDLCVSDDGPSLEREQRSVDAREVRDRLPPVLRVGTRSELEARVRVVRLLEPARTWRAGAGNVLLMGPTRVGKTTAAAILYRRLLGEGVRDGGEAWEFARFLRWFSAEELSVVRKGHPLGQGDPPAIVEACNARLLFLDEAGWDRDVGPVCEVLAERYERGTPTIVTTGLNRDQLTAHYSAAVVARMREAGGKTPTIVECFEARS